VILYHEIESEDCANIVTAATTAEIEAEIEGHVHKARNGTSNGAGRLVGGTLIAPVYHYRLDPSRVRLTSTILLHPKTMFPDSS